ncbi:MAG: 5-formyltetrahydrofolate cyclo-ligase [Hydrogenobacter sp.]
MKLLKKSELRREFLNKRDNISEEERSIYSERIKAKIKNLKEFKEAKSVLLYCPIRKEPDLTSLIWESLASKKLVLLPKVEGQELKLYSITSQEDIKPGAFCIPEPVGGKEFPPHDVELAIVPGVVFDRRGYRIGFGRGYYDRLLQKIVGVKMGVAYSFQVVEELPTDEWDQPVDVLVTESYILKGGKRYEC